MNVVILSAGQGGRLLPLTETRPKCLIPFAGRSLLEWQLRALRAGGLTRASVVTGFSADQVAAELSRLGPALGLQLEAIHNPFFALADNLASCWIARERMRGELLILNGDTLIDGRIVQRVLAAPPAAIRVTVDRKSGYDADDMKVRLDGDRLLAIGKSLDALTADGESIGLLRFSAEGAAAFVAETEAALKTPEGLKVWYLSIIDRLAKRDGVVGVTSIEGLSWGEVDYPADVEVGERLAAGWLAAEG